jgi:hypothetical protein
MLDDSRPPEVRRAKPAPTTRSIHYGSARKRAGCANMPSIFTTFKAKAVSNSPNEIDALNRGGHIDMRTTKRVYRRKPTEVIPLPGVSKKSRLALPVEPRNFQTFYRHKPLIFGWGERI